MAQILVKEKNLGDILIDTNKITLAYPEQDWTEVIINDNSMTIKLQIYKPVKDLVSGIEDICLDRVIELENLLDEAKLQLADNAKIITELNSVKQQRDNIDIENILNEQFVLCTEIENILLTK